MLSAERHPRRPAPRDGNPTLDAPAFAPSLALNRKGIRADQPDPSPCPVCPFGDPRRYAMTLLNFIAGGGASSRLFQRLREELGLAYSVYSAAYSNQGRGCSQWPLPFPPISRSRC